MELLGKNEIHFSVFNWVFFSFQLGICHHRDRWNLMKRHISQMTFLTLHIPAQDHPIVKDFL